jgi:hypothetical protein
MSTLRPILEWMLEQSETVERFEGKLRQHGVQQHWRASCREGLLGSRAFIDTLLEVLDDTDGASKPDDASACNNGKARKINISSEGAE